MPLTSSPACWSRSAASSSARSFGNAGRTPPSAVAQSPPHLLADLLGDLRHRLLHGAEMPCVHDDASKRRGGDDRRGAPLRLEQGDLAEEVARPERIDPVTVDGDLGRPFLDHEELVCELPLLHQVLAWFEVDLIG